MAKKAPVVSGIIDKPINPKWLSEGVAVYLSGQNKVKKKPEKFDQKRYEKFVEALKKNGASDTEDKKVFEYVLFKTEEWKS